jgi:hypothetical protein
MKRKAVVSFVLVMLFLVSVFPLSTFPGGADSHGGSGFSGSRFTVDQWRSTDVTNGLVGYWNFDEGSGTTAYDSSGYNNNGVIYGATWTDGRIGKALSFDGVDDYVEIAENTDLNPHTSDWTVSAWVNLNKLCPYIYGQPYIYGFVILGKRQSEFDNSLTLLVHSGTSATSQARFGFIWDGSMQAAGAQSDLMNVFGWHYVVGVRRGGELYVYVDGVEYGPNNCFYAGNNITSTTSISSATSIRLASHGSWSSYYNGTIDEVRIYDRALSAGEILAQYEASALVPIVGTFTTVMSSNTTSWDTTAIGTPYVLFDSQAGLYKMWYTALSEPTYWPPYWVCRWVIGYAESKDGVVWVNKTIVQDTGAPSYYYDGEPWVLKENGTYLMWHMEYYEWVGADWSEYITRMSSADGVNWPTFQSPGDQKVLSAQGQSNPQGDGRSVSEPWIIHTPGQGYTMWYSVYDYPAPGRGGPQKIWTTTSADGVSWSNRQLSLPYVNGSWEANVRHPSVVKEEDGTYTMFYAASDANGSSSIGVARGLDGTSWTNRTQLIKPSDLNANVTSISDPSFFQDVDGREYLYFTFYDGTNKFGRLQLSNGPAPKIIDPNENDGISGNTELYATDQVNVMTITSATFEYSQDGSRWTFIGTDTNGTMEVQSENRTTYDVGLWNVTWATSGLTEGHYYVRVTMTDTNGRTGQDLVSVYVDPTPPIPTIVEPTDGESVNGLVTIDATTTDENVNVAMAEDVTVPVQVPDPTPFKVGVPCLNQHDYGPLAGAQPGTEEWNNNHYCGPTAAASVLKWWADNGYPELLTDPNTKQPIPINTLVRVLAAVACVKEWPEKNPGTNLFRLKGAIETWIKSHGAGLTVEIVPQDFKTFKKELESHEMLIVNTGLHTLVGNSVSNKQNDGGTYNVDFMDPWTGGPPYVLTKMYPNGTFEYGGGWCPLPRGLPRGMIAISPKPKPPAPGLPPVPQPPQNCPQWKSLPCRYENHQIGRAHV